MSYILKLAVWFCFFMCYPTDRIAHTTAFVNPIVEHSLKREVAQWVRHDMRDQSNDPSHHIILFRRAVSISSSILWEMDSVMTVI